MSLDFAYHDTRRSPLGLWQLNGDYQDSSGNGRHLTLNGTATWVDVMGWRAPFFNQSTYLSLTDAALRLGGSMTFECMFSTTSSASARRTLVYCGNPGTNTAADNTLYGVSLENAAPGNPVRVFSESGSGAVANTTFSDLIWSRVPYHLAVVRAVSGASAEWRYFLNGEKMGTTTLAAPDGGSSGGFRLGGGESGTSFYGAIWSAQLIGSALTDDQVYEDASYTGFAWSQSVAMRRARGLGPSIGNAMPGEASNKKARGLGPYATAVLRGRQQRR